MKIFRYVQAVLNHARQVNRAFEKIIDCRIWNKAYTSATQRSIIAVQKPGSKKIMAHVDAAEKLK